MKKFLLTIGFVLTSGFILWAESPSLDGRALVADEGLFPKGLFAKTVGYLPGDSISVTNPANNERVDILVIGSLDPSEGVAILLSPEAAGALNIKKNANNLVKLTKRNGAADEIVNGSAVLTNGPAVEEIEQPAENQAEKTVEQVVEEALESGTPVEEAVAEAVEEAEEKIAEAEAEKESEEVLAASPVEESGEVADASEEEAYPQYEEPVVDELAQDGENEVEDDFVEANVIDEPPLVEEEPVVAVVEAVPEEEPVKEEEALLDEYDAIVLVPSDAKAPEISANVEESPVRPEPVKEDEAVGKKSVGVSYLSGYGELAAQKYYVQIAVYNKAENVEQIAAKYADLYPVAVVNQYSNASVLIGPLNMDEYGVVLERFKSYGFKDAFVKVGSGEAKKASYNVSDFER